ncbi:MAG: ATPase [Pseudomonadota bacterium]
MNLAERLLKAQMLTPEELAPALYRQKKTRGFLAKHLLDLKLIEPKVLAKFVQPRPQAPETFEETGLPKNLLIQLILKHANFLDFVTPREMSRDIKIPKHLTETLFEHLKDQNYLFVKPRDLLTKKNHIPMEMRYALTDAGKIYAEQCLEANRYVGPAPVPLEDYWDWVEAQTIHQVKVEQKRLKEVFADYVVSPSLLNKIGPAINSGRSIFLFGPSGNGKTVMANCIGQAFEDAVYIPYALYVYGQIIRVYDEVNHQPVPQPPDGPPHDTRWIQCRRPVVIAGGEMTEEALELKFNPITKFYEAPHQMRANNGIFIIDDFGRQKVSPRQLLNRWMYPLETRQDFCCLHTGQQFGIPFDQLIIFSTNLNPYSLADEAFLRRIRHKIFVGYVSPEQYLEIFRRVCVEHNIPFDPEIIRDMMARYYVIAARPLCACHPRDLIENLLDRARFMGQSPRLTSQELDYVCQTYFVKPMGITDYDAIGGGDEPKLIV